jgi:acetyl-CoA carboxylase carboxyl transferase subunit alpha
LQTYFDFEKDIKAIEEKIEELSALTAQSRAASMGVEVSRLKAKAEKTLADLYSKLDPWQKTQVARHQDRPRFRDYIQHLVTDFVELSGDRTFGEDAAILGGLGKFRGVAAVLIGHEKGRTTQDRLKHNFGMAMPEGYRKAIRLMDLAERFELPVITLVDTAGAYPGIGAEERGQAEAIARSTERCLTLKTPLISVIVGEGGSGGAIALAAGNKVLMLEHAIYSVISPEGAASILWKDAARAKDAAAAMKITAPDLLSMNVIDTIVQEPVGGAHREPLAAMDATAKAVLEALEQVGNMPPDELIAQREARFMAIGRVGLTANKDA